MFLRLSSLSALVASVALVVLGGCTSSSSGTGGAGGAGGSTSTGSGCHGDQAAFDEIQAHALDCTKNSDCCVVVNGCLSAAQVVTAADETAAAAAWPYCDDLCVGCIAPAIEVGCVNGKCVGQNVDSANPPPPDTLRQTHCGEDPTPLAPTDPKLTFSCGG